LDHSAGRGALGQNRTPEALKLLDDANQIDGVNATRWMLLSLAESQAGHMDRAEQPIGWVDFVGLRRG
jgi:hypothetical protein